MNRALSLLFVAGGSTGLGAAAGFLLGGGYGALLLVIANFPSPSSSAGSTEIGIGTWIAAAFYLGIIGAAFGALIGGILGATVGAINGIVIGALTLLAFLPLTSARVRPYRLLTGILSAVTSFAAALITGPYILTPIWLFSTSPTSAPEVASEGWVWWVAVPALIAAVAICGTTSFLTRWYARAALEVGPAIGEKHEC